MACCFLWACTVCAHCLSVMLPCGWMDGKLTWRLLCGVRLCALSGAAPRIIQTQYQWAGNALRQPLLQSGIAIGSQVLAINHCSTISDRLCALACTSRLTWERACVQAGAAGAHLPGGPGD